MANLIKKLIDINACSWVGDKKFEAQVNLWFCRYLGRIMNRSGYYDRIRKLESDISELQGRYYGMDRLEKLAFHLAPYFRHEFKLF